MKAFLLIVLSTMALLHSVCSAAVPLTLSFTARVIGVSDSNGLLGGTVKPDDQLTGTISYTADALDISSLAKVGVYEFRSGAQIIVNKDALTFQSDPVSPYLRLEVVNDSPAGKNRGIQDVFLLRSYTNLALSTGVTVDHISWQIVDSSASAVSGKSLPITALKLTDWRSEFGLTIEGQSVSDKSRTYLIRAEITGLSVKK